MDVLIGQWKTKESTEKTAFKVLQQFIVWRVSEGKWKTIRACYGYFNPNFNGFLQVSNSNPSVRVTL